MARTTEMKLFELLVLKNDISRVIEYIGKKGTFQFRTGFKENKSSEISENLVDINSHFYDELKNASINLGLNFNEIDLSKFSSPTEDTCDEVVKFLESYHELEELINQTNEENTKICDAYKEAMAFSNLQVSYSELEHLSFLSLKIGKLPNGEFDSLKEALEDTAVVISLGEDKTNILVASSKKGRFAVETELKAHNFVVMQVPEDFKGVPQSVLDGLKQQKIESEQKIALLTQRRKNFTETHKEIIKRLLASFSIGQQIENIVKNLDSTDMVYRITGWIPSFETESYMKELDNLTESRIVIRQFEPFEVASVLSGKEQVPVKLKHGKFVKSFERMIFSYGSPIYGTIDPSPFVAVFFTLLFGIMFGDLGQGLFFVFFGILMNIGIIKVGGWNKFAPIFMAIGISSSIMGLLTGEFFGTEKLLEPFALWITQFFGKPHSPILHLMPSDDPNSILVMFSVFGVAVAIGFIINTCGLVLNIINNFTRKKYAEALFGKNGLSGAIFFWYVIFMILRIVLFNHSVKFYDIIIISLSLFFAAFASPFERAMKGEKPLLENGIGTYLISGVVELIEVISGYLSNTVSFVRVGAFALSHTVLNFTILTLTNLCGGVNSVGGIFVLIGGNALIIVLEGMIVAIQVIRLQYYEFFGKFFHETGKEFTPFKFLSDL